MGNLATNKVFAWTADDNKVSEVMQGYFANFVKTGNPNGAGLPKWPAANSGSRRSSCASTSSRASSPTARVTGTCLLDSIYAKK